MSLAFNRTLASPVVTEHTVSTPHTDRQSRIETRLLLRGSTPPVLHSAVHRRSTAAPAFPRLGSRCLFTGGPLLLQHFLALAPRHHGSQLVRLDFFCESNSRLAGSLSGFMSPTHFSLESLHDLMSPTHISPESLVFTIQESYCHSWQQVETQHLLALRTSPACSSLCQ